MLHLSWMSKVIALKLPLQSFMFKFFFSPQTVWQFHMFYLDLLNMYILNWNKRAHLTNLG